MKKGLIYKSSFLTFLLVPFLAGCSGSNECVIKFVNYDGSVLQEEKVKKGTEVTYKKNRPMHFDDNSSYYKFKGWDKDIEVAKGDTTYTALFDAYPLTTVEEDPDSYVEELPSATKDGNILQAFCWTYNDVKKQLPYIKDAGFKTVQISPVQVPKSSGSSWWAFYQPLSFTIADGDESPLGTKAELEAMCAEAETYGISVIADIVFNHMANISDDDKEADGTPKVAPQVENYEPDIYAQRNNSTNPTFHHYAPSTGCGSETQVYPYGGLPDLNTGNELVQERCYSLLKECIDVGIDGFRFDAAKHIETPDDPEYESNFWPETLGKAKTYYRGLTGKDLFAYGEILGKPVGRSIDVYTKLMNVSEGSYGPDIERGLLALNATDIKNSSYGQSTSVSNMVSWLESHDSYLGETVLSDSYIGREWAVLANRKNSTCMFLARPETTKADSGQDNATVGIIYDYFFRDEAVGAVNRFHNRFIGAEESQGVDGTIYFNERYSSEDKGAIVLDTAKSSKIIVEFEHLGTDVYYDQLTGKSVTVRDGHATVELNKEGVAILTKSKNQPRPTFEISEHGGLFADNKTVKVEYNPYVTEATYQINDGATVAFTSGSEITFTKDQTVLNTVKLTINVKNSQYEISEDFYYSHVELVPGYFNIVNVNPAKLDTEHYTLYMWSWGGDDNGHWSKEFTAQGNSILVADSLISTKTGIIIAVFEGQNYEVENINKWDSHAISQTTDIAGSVIEQGYYDGSRL